MSAIFELNKFGELPNWAQVLIASRMLRRAALAMLDDKSECHIAMDRACDGIERCAMQGGGVATEEQVIDQVRLMGSGPDAVLPTFLANSMRWLIDSTRAAESANDFPIDGTVTSSAINVLYSLCEDRRVSQIQIAVLVASDLDQIRFTCEEAKIGKYDGLTEYVFARIAPVHAITIDHSPPTTNEENIR